MSQNTRRGPHAWSQPSPHLAVEAQKAPKSPLKTSSAAPESNEHTAAGQWRPWQRRAEFNGSPSTLSDVSVLSARGQEHAADSKWWPGPRARESAVEWQNCLVNCSCRGLSRWQPSSSELRATRCDWREHKFRAYFSLRLRKQRQREDLYYETSTCSVHGGIIKTGSQTRKIAVPTFFPQWLFEVLQQRQQQQQKTCSKSKRLQYKNKHLFNCWQTDGNLK